MGINLKGIEAKLNEFNNKLNEIGDQVSDALNSGFSSFDETLNSVVGSFDEATDNLAVKYDEMKSKNDWLVYSSIIRSASLCICSFEFIFFRKECVAISLFDISDFRLRLKFHVRTMFL